MWRDTYLSQHITTCAKNFCIRLSPPADSDKSFPLNSYCTASRYLVACGRRFSATYIAYDRVKLGSTDIPHGKHRSRNYWHAICIAKGEHPGNFALRRIGSQTNTAEVLVMKPACILILSVLLTLVIGHTYARNKTSSSTTSAPPSATQPVPTAASKTRAPAAITKSRIPCTHQSSINHDERLIAPETEAAWNQARMRSRQKSRVPKQPPCIL